MTEEEIGSRLLGEFLGAIPPTSGHGAETLQLTLGPRRADPPDKGQLVGICPGLARKRRPLLQRGGGGAPFAEPPSLQAPCQPSIDAFRRIVGRSAPVRPASSFVASAFDQDFDAGVVHKVLDEEPVDPEERRRDQAIGR